MLPADLSETGLLYGDIINDINTPGAERIVVPGYPELSQLYLRLEAGNACCSMPPIAVNITDQEARDAVAQWILGLSDLPASQTEFTRPVDVIASSTWSGGGPGGMSGNDDVWALHLIQAPGSAIGDPDPDVTLTDESAGATHGASAGGASFGQWHSDDGDTTPYILLDLGESAPIDAAHLWQSNQTNNLNGGIQQFDLHVANDVAAFDAAEAGNGALWTEVLSDQVMTISPGGAIPSQDYGMGGVLARYVQIEVDSNYGRGNTGLAEVRFTTRSGGGDLDGDGIGDAAEGLDDVDQDGIPNLLDLFSDGDSIADAVEGVADFDSDGLADFLDPDNDNDGIPDALECVEGGDCDPDTDGIDSPYDLDSDDDGISDADEASGDLDGDGFTGLQELFFGTDPELRSEAPWWRLDPPAHGADPWRMSVGAARGRIYTLQGSPKPGGPWSDLSTTGTTDGPATVTLDDSVPSASRAEAEYFFRIGVKTAPR